jgi:hypothetical protein
MPRRNPSERMPQRSPLCATMARLCRSRALCPEAALHIGSPRNPEIPWQHLDTEASKRSSRLDCDDAADCAEFEELLLTPDAFLTA